MIKMKMNIKIYLPYLPMNSKMVLFILDNGNKELDMVEENNIGTMVLFMKDIGKVIWPMEKVD